MANLKRVYAAPTEEPALSELDSFDEKWTGHRQDWGNAHLEIFFEGRLS
jgi:hypothetical protein